MPVEVGRVVGIIFTFQIHLKMVVSRKQDWEGIKHIN
jgi:hypothetical protein